MQELKHAPKTQGMPTLSWYISERRCQPRYHCPSSRLLRNPEQSVWNFFPIHKDKLKKDVCNSSVFMVCIWWRVRSTLRIWVNEKTTIEEGKPRYVCILNNFITNNLYLFHSPINFLNHFPYLFSSTQCIYIFFPFKWLYTTRHSSQEEAKIG